MKRIALILSLLVGALAFTAVGIAGPGHGKKSQSSKNNKFTYTVTTTDGSSCGAELVWATDVVHRTFKVTKRGPNTYSIRRTDRGRFTTLGTLSPGKCETKSNHGSTVKAGVVGKLQQERAVHRRLWVHGYVHRYPLRRRSREHVHVLQRLCRLQVQLPVQLERQEPEVPPLAGSRDKRRHRRVRRRHRQLVTHQAPDCGEARFGGPLRVPGIIPA